MTTMFHPFRSIAWQLLFPGSLEPSQALSGPVLGIRMFVQRLTYVHRIYSCICRCAYTTYIYIYRYIYIYILCIIVYSYIKSIYIACTYTWFNHLCGFYMVLRKYLFHRMIIEPSQTSHISDPPPVQLRNILFQVASILIFIRSTTSIPYASWGFYVDTHLLLLATSGWFDMFLSFIPNVDTQFRYGKDCK